MNILTIIHIENDNRLTWFIVKVIIQIDTKT